MTQRRRIVHVGPSLTARGGIARVMQTLVTSDLARDYDLEILETVGDSWRGGVLASLKARQRLKRLVATSPRPLVHVHMSARGSFVRKAEALRVARRGGCITVLHLHGSQFHRFVESLSSVGRHLVRRTFDQCDAVVVLSPQWELRVREFCTPRRVIVIPNPVFIPAAFGLGRDSRTVAFVGRLGDRKGVPDLLEAIGLMQSHGATWRWIMMGDGEVGLTRSLVQRLPEPGLVEVTGWIDHEGAMAHVSQAAVFCLPSHDEGVPVAMLEAMARGLACVVTGVGGVPSVVEDGLNGLLVPVGDTAALADALGRVLADASLAGVLGQNARRTVIARFSVDAAVLALEELYADLGFEPVAVES
jgi:glycosyltransferase involved in cell wall biosynthesis